MSLDLATVRAQFPALARKDIFFDNPGGTQIAAHSLKRIQDYLVECNANHGGAFITSRQSDAVLDEAHAAMADFLNAARPEEIIFGANMTTLTLHISRSLGRMLSAGDTILLTRLDHDANVAPWMLLAEDLKCKLIWVDFDVEDGTLNMESYQKALEQKPKLAAFGYASNALGTVNPIKKMIEMAHQAGALTYIDAVQYAPHGPIDVQYLDADFLVCSAYKFFGPHAGILYGKYDLLNPLKAYKVRPATNDLPGRFETGTQNHEGIAGVLGAIEHFEWLANQFGGEHAEGLSEENYQGRRMRLKQAMTSIRAYEFELSRALIKTLQEIPGLQIYGPTDLLHLENRVPTVSFRIEGKHPRQLAEQLSQAGIYVWDGNYYALSVTERLNVEDKGGMLRVGAAHYNTLDEIARLGDELKKIVAR